MRKCKRCGVKLPSDSERLVCPPCHRIQVNEARNRKRVESPEEYFTAQFNDRLWSLFRMRREDYNAILARQGNACGACGGQAIGKRGWHIDHDHACCPGNKSCGKCVRGVLCPGCNSALGHVKDDVTRLMALANYLAHTRTPV